MSQWDGLPETPPPVSMLGPKGCKAQETVRDLVIAMSKPATNDQARAISEARQSAVTQIMADEVFDPASRVAELEAELADHSDAIDRLLADLGAQRGAQRWAENVVVGYRPAPTSADGQLSQRLRSRQGPIAASELIAVLREAVGVSVPEVAEQHPWRVAA